LIGFKLIHEGKLLNAALALFGKGDRLHPLYPQFSIRVARFRGKNRLADFQDNRIYWGNAFDLLRRGESFLLDHVPIGGRVKPGVFIREDYPLYPTRATREALANAICHRDYAGFEGAIAVAMYDDHLEIINPGSFHFGFTPEKIILPHTSRPWNPIIANVFYRTGIIEHWGTGTLNIIDWCKENKNPIPSWEEQTGTVVVTFTPSTVFLDEQKESELVPGHDAGHVERQADILEFCAQPRTTKEIMGFLKLKHRETFYQKYLKPLTHNKLLLLTIPEKPQSKNQQYYANQESRK
jgi:ATP-dependent DNA helicase RecG